MIFSAEIIWVLIGIVLIFFEFFIPGLVIAFFGGGALLTALLTWIGVTTTLATQLITFMLSSLLSVILLRRYFKSIFAGKLQGENGNMEFNLDIGKIVPVVEPITPGKVGGKVRYQGTLWAAQSDTVIEAGENVKIKDRDNLTIIVEKINQGGV